MSLPDDVPDDVRRHAEIEQQRHAGVPDAVEPYINACSLT